MTAYEHIVVFRFKPSVSRAQQDGLVATLLAFPGVIPGILELTAGINETEETENVHGYTLGLRITFQDRQALTAYQPHASHQAFVRQLDGLIENVVVMDYPVTVRMTQN
ncbi:Dabb family protein [Deinococcus sp. UYEF24]